MLLEPIPSTNYDTKMIKTSTCSLITTLYVSLWCIAYAFPTNFITVLSTNARHITKGVCQGQRDIETSHRREWHVYTLNTWHVVHMTYIHVMDATRVLLVQEWGEDSVNQPLFEKWDYAPQRKSHSKDGWSLSDQKTYLGNVKRQVRNIINISIS